MPAEGSVESLSGTHDCAAGQTCVIHIPGVEFTETFTAIPNPGFKFVKWQEGLCSGKTDPACVLSAVPPSLTGLDLDTYLEPLFAELTLLDLLPLETRGVLQVYPGATGAMAIGTAGADWGMGAQHILKKYGQDMDIAGATEQLLLAQMADAPEQFVLLLALGSSDVATLTAGASLTSLPPQGYALWSIDNSDLQLIQLNANTVAIASAAALARVVDVYEGTADSIADGNLAEFLPALQLPGLANSFVYGLPALYGPVSPPGDGSTSLSQARAVNGLFNINGDTLSGAVNFFTDDDVTYAAKLQEVLSGLNAPTIFPVEPGTMSVSLNGLSATQDLAPLFKTLLLEMDNVDYAEAVVEGGNPPWMNFEVGGDPAAIFINFEISPTEVANFEAAHLPAGFSLVPFKMLATDTPRYMLVLNIYQASGGLVEGARAEWSVFVADPDTGAPRFMVVEAKAETISADSVNLLTLGEPVSYQQTPTALESWVGVDEFTTYFSASIPWPQLPETMVAFDRAFMTANDFVFWGNAVADRILYNSTAHNIDAVLINPGDISIVDNSTWSAYINPIPLHAVVYSTNQEIVISPWWNLDANYLDVTPEYLTSLINFKNGFYPATVQNNAKAAIRGDGAALSSITLSETVPTARYHFPLLDPAGLLTAADAPVTAAPTPIALFDGETAAHYLTLSVYQRTDDPCGLRGEWTTYVTGPDGRIDSLRLDAFASDACLDPISLLTVATAMSQSESSGWLTTTVASPATQIEATINLNIASPVLASQNWLEAGEQVCALNGICDEFYYDGQLLMGTALRADASAIQLLEFETPWNAYIDTNAVRAGVRTSASLQAYNPWRNLRSFAADNPAP